MRHLAGMEIRDNYSLFRYDLARTNRESHVADKCCVARPLKRAIAVGLFNMLVTVTLFSTACVRRPNQESFPVQYSATPIPEVVPLGLPSVESPTTNPMTVEKVTLGKRLFFDKNLSVDRSLSCASCHDPMQGWSNGQPVAIGVNGARGTRNVPTIFNVAYNRVQFWDGRVTSLERQALGPMLNPLEMGMTSGTTVLERIREDPAYDSMFAQAFRDGLTIENVARSLAAFERTVLAGDAPYDRFQAGDEQAMSDSAKRGLEIFLKKGRCVACHKPPNFTDISYHNIGIGFSGTEPDAGRYAVTRLQSNFGAFKSPTLRQLTKTAPYMHDGSLATLKEVVDYYDKGGNVNPQLSRDIRKLNLAHDEKRDLIQFMVEGLGSVEESPTVTIDEIGTANQ